jgi:hypothetical protein
MLQDLQVEGAISVGGGLNVLTTSSGYTKDQMNSTFNALNGTVTDTEIVSIPDLVIVPKADKATTYDKTEVDTLLAQKANDETTYNMDQITSLFIRSDPYLVQDPLQKVFVPDPDRETGNKLELSLSSVFTDSVNTKINETQVLALLADYQPMLIAPSDEGRNLLRPDGITLLAIEEGQFMNITPEFSIRGNTPVNFRLKIGITNEFANQVIDATSNIATLQTQIADIQSPFWIAARISVSGSVVFNRGKQSITNVSKVGGDTIYDITFPAHPSGVDAIVILSGCEYFNFYRNQTATSIRVYTRTGNNTPTAGSNGEFNIMIVA